MTGLRLGLADLWHEPWVLLCQLAALAAVIAPLLVLAGLRVGVVEGLLAALRDDPSNRRVIIRGDHSLTPADLAWIRARPEVGFAIPTTRSIAARAFLATVADPGLRERAGLLPSTAGDPLLPGHLALGETEIALSATLRRRLGIPLGARLVARNTRGTESPEAIELPLTVVAVVRDDWLPGASALVHPAVLERIEAFLDGFALPELGIEGRAAEERPMVHENLRLYAARLEDVAPLAEAVRARFGVETVSAEERIAEIRALDRNLLLVFALVTLIAGAGLVLSVAAQAWGNVERKRAHLSVLRLLGGSRAILALFPAGQALAVALGGFALALGAYALLAWVINRAFGEALPQGAALCRLAPGDLAAAAGATLGAVLLAAAAAGWRASRVEPAEGIVAP